MNAYLGEFRLLIRQSEPPKYLNLVQFCNFSVLRSSREKDLTKSVLVYFAVKE
jgi:hypothetical protein